MVGDHFYKLAKFATQYTLTSPYQDYKLQALDFKENDDLTSSTTLLSIAIGLISKKGINLKSSTVG